MLFEQAINTDPGKTISPLVPAVTMTSEAIDLEVLNAFDGLQADDGSDLIVELIDLYLQDASERIAAIKFAIANADGKVLKVAAHTLKGSSSSLGVLHVAELCATLEQLDPVEFPQRVGALEQLLTYKFARVKEVFAAERQRRLA